MSMGEISGELAYVMAAQRARETADDIDLLLVPPVQEYRTLDFHKADEIVETGYKYAVAQLSHWRVGLRRAAAAQIGTNGSSRGALAATPGRRFGGSRKVKVGSAHSGGRAAEGGDGDGEGTGEAGDEVFAASGWRGTSYHRVLSSYMARQASG